MTGPRNKETPYLEDADFTLYNGDVRQMLAAMAAESVHCVVTSPPYWGLRDYGTGTWDGGDPDCDHTPPPTRYSPTSTLKNDGRKNPGAKNYELQTPTPFGQSCGKCGASRVDNQLGLEPTPDQYLENMVQVFREVRRVLRSDGTCWVNMGDSYAASLTSDRRMFQPTRDNDRSGGVATRREPATASQRTAVAGLKPKDLCMIPARLALALQADGWWLRSQIVWSKPNPMPESVTDRPTTSHEYVYLLTKSPRYFFDQEAVREPHNDKQGLERFNGSGGSTPGYDPEHQGWVDGGGFKMKPGGRDYNPSGRNIRSVWEIPTQPYPEAHFATYPEELVRRCILAGTSERGCCAECGAPWERIIETNNPSLHAADADKRGWSNTHSKTSNAQSSKSLHRNPGGVYSSAVVKGWRQTCDHGTEPVPCTVLDPFMGSGTTALVARKHGRRSVGVELNPAYCELAARRLSQLSLLTEGAA